MTTLQDQAAAGDVSMGLPPASNAPGSGLSERNTWVNAFLDEIGRHVSHGREKLALETIAQARAALASRSTEPGGEARRVGTVWIVDGQAEDMEMDPTAEMPEDGEHGLFLASTPSPASASREAAPAGLPLAQEPKYTVTGTHIVNRASGEAIPHDEPVFIFRARDRLAFDAIMQYSRMCRDPEHARIVEGRAWDFVAFANSNPSRMKEPDTYPAPAQAPHPPWCSGGCCNPEQSSAVKASEAEALATDIKHAIAELTEDEFPDLIAAIDRLAVLAAKSEPRAPVLTEFSSEDLEAVADGLAVHEKGVAVGFEAGMVVKVESTTAYAERFIRAYLAAVSQPPGGGKA